MKWRPVAQERITETPNAKFVWGFSLTKTKKFVIIYKKEMNIIYEIYIIKSLD